MVNIGNNDPLVPHLKFVCNELFIISFESHFIFPLMDVAIYVTGDGLLLFSNVDMRATLVGNLPYFLYRIQSYFPYCVIVVQFRFVMSRLTCSAPSHYISQSVICC